MESAGSTVSVKSDGQAQALFASRKESKQEKCKKKPQNSTRQVHAILGDHLIFI